MPPRSGATTGINISFIADDRGVQALLNRMETGFSPVAMAGFLSTVIGPWLNERAKNRFQNEGDDVSGAWAPLRPATQEIRRNGPWSVGAAHPINVRTGEMERYVTGGATPAIATGPIATLIFPEVSNSGGSELRKKMKTAQKGAKQKGLNATPPRPVIGLGVQDLTFMLSSLHFYAERIQRGGRR